MNSHHVDDFRNVALVGHGATGKTTLADLLLYKSGAVKKPGSVEEGSSILDSDEEERTRQSSISSALAHLEHGGKRVNLIDTPGYPDFIGQAIGALWAVETAAITVSASAGIEVNTRRVFTEAGKAGVGRIIVLNKCDAENLDFSQLLSDLQETFGQACVPLNVPVGLGPDFSGVVDTLKLPENVPDGVAVDPAETNQTVMDAIVEADEALMERFLEGEELSTEEVAGGVTKAIAAGTLIPIFCLSAKTGVGVPEFLDALRYYAPAPPQITRTAQTTDGDQVTLNQSPEERLLGQVFKTRIDPFVGKLSYIRLFCGSIARDAAVYKTGSEKPLKFSQLMDVQGGSQETVDKVSAGNIFAVAKMEDLKVGDTVTAEAGGPSLPTIPFPKPMIFLAVEPKSRADQQKISGALQKVLDEDPTFQTSRDAQTKELVMQGMSELHLQIVQDRLQRRDKVEIVTHQPKIPYRETVSGSAEGSYRHKKQTGGAGQFAEVHFRISALPRDVDPEEYFTKARFENMREHHYDPELNYAFVDRITGGVVPNQFIPAVEKGIRERMEQGVLAGYQVQDVCCELYYGKYHPVDSNEAAFKTAGSMCFRDVFMQAKPTILEPIAHVEVTVPDEYLGDITSDLNTRRGRVEGMDSAPGGMQIIRAKVPLAEVMTYARSLSSMTGGEGSFTMELSHYEMVPPNEQQKIVEAAQKRREEQEA